MKVRNGFVSNSSSSSFIIASKGSDDLTTDSLTSLLDVNTSSPLYPLAQRIANFLIKSSTTITRKNYSSEYGEELEEGVESGHKVAKLIKDGYTVKIGYASYSETHDPIELMIGSGGLKNIETPNIVIFLET